MALLSWEKPKKVRSTKDHNAMHSADCSVPGTYAPNMSQDDKLKWKAKKIGGKDPRIEVRKTTEGVLVSDGNCTRWEGAAQVLIVVRPDGTAQFSMNSKARFDVSELCAVFGECRVEMSTWSTT